MSGAETQAGSKITVARTAADLKRCHAVMRELRPKFQSEDEFVAQVQRQQQQGYEIAFVEEQGEIRAVAGYRCLESLYAGKFIYVDDLVTRESDRSRGFGGELLEWLFAEAAARGCARLELDSGVHRKEAHRFYFSKRMTIDSFHFGRSLNARSDT